MPPQKLLIQARLGPPSSPSLPVKFPIPIRLAAKQDSPSTPTQLFKHHHNRVADTDYELTATAAKMSDYSLSESSLNQTQVVGPFDENSEIVVECFALGGVPAPKLIWLHNGEQIDNSYELRSSNGMKIVRHDQQQNSIEQTMIMTTTTTTTTSAPSDLQESEFNNIEEGKLRQQEYSFASNSLHLQTIQRSSLLTNFTCVAVNEELEINESIISTKSVLLEMNRKYTM